LDVIAAPGQLNRWIASVERYWLGVKSISPETVIYAGVRGGDCDVPYVKGNQYFFWASRVNGLLETSICSPYKITDELVDGMNSVFGTAREFRQSKTKHNNSFNRSAKLAWFS
jgi:hypothetical protein